MDTSGRAHLDDLDLTAPGLYAGGFPHDVFADIRCREPVAWQPFSDAASGAHDEGFWVLSKHADIQAASRDTDLFSALDGPQLSLRPDFAGTTLVSMDGDAHRRQRRLISAGFTPRMVALLEKQIRTWAESLVDGALERPECNFVAEVAYTLPMNMIADIMGIPVDDRDWLFTHANDALQAGVLDRPMSPQEEAATWAGIFDYAHRLGEEKRRDPRDDVWSILSSVEVGDEEGGRTSLSQIELDMFFLLLIVAGSETTRNAIAHGLAALLENPDQLERLRREPDVIPTAMEEVLRWSSPVACFARRATRDTEIRGVPIARGARVGMWYPSGNRDEEVFDDPFRFDIGRSPNPHVAFGGGGAHFCLGASLARRELVTLFEVLFERTRSIELVKAPSYTVLGIDNPIVLFMDELIVAVE